MLAHRQGDDGIHHDTARARTLYQTSTMSALLDGIYDGSVTVAELLEHGDFGVGTFNHLDGEMIVNDGVCFHLFSNGEASVASPDDLTPFAAVTTFEADTTLQCGDAHIPRRTPVTQIDRRVSSENLFYGIRVSGHFATVSTRTAARQEAPYRPLPEATTDESERTFPATGGVLVGFRTPDYEQGISVPATTCTSSTRTTLQAATPSTSCSTRVSSRFRPCRKCGSVCRRPDRSSPPICT
jgi:acetolactate decarboxylase